MSEETKSPKKQEQIPFNIDDQNAISLTRPGFYDRARREVFDSNFWSKWQSLDYWERGCFGRSLAIGVTVSAIAGIHSFRHKKPGRKIVDWVAFGFMFSFVGSYLQCRLAETRALSPKRFDPTTKI